MDYCAKLESDLRSRVDEINWDNYSGIAQLSVNFIREMKDKFGKNPISVTTISVLYQKGGKRLIEEIYGNIRKN